MAEYDSSVKIPVEFDTSGVERDVDKLRKELDFSDVNAKNTQSTNKYTEAIRQATIEAAKIKNELDELSTKKINTAEYDKLYQQWRNAEAQADRLRDAYAKANAAEQGQGFVDKLERQMISAADKAEILKMQLDAMKAQGTDFQIGDDVQAEKLQARYDALITKIALMKKEEDNSSESSNNLKKILDSLGKSVSRLTKYFGAGVDSITRYAKALFSLALNPIIQGFRRLIPGLNKTNKAFKLNFNTILKYAFGIRSLYFLFRKIRVAIAEGFKNLVQFQGGNNKVNEAVSILTSSLLQLKNTLATAFAPIVVSIIPALNAMIQAMNSAITAIGMFIAKITGQSTFIRAKKIQEDYAKSLDKTAGAASSAYKQLAPFDDLQVLTQDSGGGGGTAIDDMFEEVPLEDFKFPDPKDLAGEFTDWIKGLLGSIDWKSLQDYAKKLGKWLADFLNRVFEDLQLARLIGYTIAQALNTALDFIYNLVDILNWRNLGRWLGELVRYGILEFHWELLGETIAKYLNGLANIVIGFFEKYPVGLLGESIASTINSIIKWINPIEIGTAIALLIKAAFGEIESFFSNTDFRELGNKISLIITTAITHTENGKSLGRRVGESIASIINAGIDFLSAIGLGKIVNTLFQFFTDVFTATFKKIKWKDIGRAVGQFLVDIDWVNVLKEVGKAIWTAINTAFELYENVFETAPLETALGTLLGALAVFGPAVVDILAPAIAQLVNLPMLAATAISGVAGAISFATLKDSIYDISMGIGELGTNLVELGTSLGVLVGAFTLVFGFPSGTIAGLIAATAAGFMGLKNAIEDTAEIEKYGDTIDNIADRVTRKTEEIRDSVAKTQETVDVAGEAEFAMAQSLADKYFELAEKKDRSNEETALMKELAGKLIEVYPELTKFYDEENGLLNANRDAIQEVIDRKLQEIKLKAQEEQLIELYKQQAEAARNVEDAQKAVDEATKGLKDAQQDYQKAVWTMDAAQKYQELREEIRTAKGDTSELEQQQRLLMDYLQSQDVNTEYPNFGALRRNIEESSKRLQEYKDEDLEKLWEPLKDAQSAKADIDKTIKEVEKSWMDGMIEVGKSGTEGFEKGYNENADSMSNAVVSSLDSKTGVLYTAMDTLDAHSPSREFEKIGQYSVEGYVKGFDENADTALTRVEQFATDILDTFQTALLDGISPIIEEYFSYAVWTEMWNQILLSVEEFFESFLTMWTEKLTTWQTENDELYFGYEVWKTQWNNVYKAYTDIWNLFFNTWQVNMKLWWNTFVIPYFTVAQWKIFGTNMKTGILGGFKEIVGEIGGLLNQIIDLFNTACNQIKDSMNDLIEQFNRVAARLGVESLPTVSFRNIPRLKIPALAEGAVIPPNREFLAILGDQQNGTNIEAPLDTIVEAFKQVMGEREVQTMGASTMELDGETFARIITPYIMEEWNRQGYNVAILEG